MAKVELIDGLSMEDKQLLIDALRALRTERGKAWNQACDVAQAADKRRPSLKPYGIDQITRMARRLGGGATHWMDE